MKKYIFIICTLLLSIISYGQNKRDTLKILYGKLNKVHFVISDTLFTHTQITNPQGDFSFLFIYKEADSSNFSINPSLYNGIPYKVKYKNNSDRITTINTYYPYTKQDFEKDTSLIVYFEILNKSYILKQLKEQPLYNTSQNYIRYVYLGLNKKDRYYNSMELKLFDDTIKMRVKKGWSQDTSGIHLISIDSCILKKKDVKKINSLLKKMTLIKTGRVIDCKPTNIYSILESNFNNEYKYFVITDNFDCKIELPLELGSFLESLNNKYF